MLNHNDRIDEPLVSIGITTYNRLEGLRKTLECFCNQTYRNLEIIVSDNCSIEDPTEMVEEFIKHDDRIRYFRQNENIGMAGNGSFVWGMARGEFFTLASDDDWWGADFVLELVTLLQKNKDAVCAFCDFQEIDVSGVKIERYPYHYPLLKEFDNQDVVARLTNFILQKENHGKANMHRSICYRNVFLDSVNRLDFFELRSVWAFDQLLAFTFLIEGRLVVSDKLLFKCTVGNEKHYEDPRSRLKYLEAYLTVMEDSLSSEETDKLLKPLNKRFYDKEIGFYQEFLGVIKEFISKALIETSNISLYDLQEIKDLISSNENLKAVKLARELSELLPSPSNITLWSNRIKNIFATGVKKESMKIAKEIMRELVHHEKN
jgi:glycosyltransferase involved in cell wall biosynthesis